MTATLGAAGVGVGPEAGVSAPVPALAGAAAAGATVSPSHPPLGSAGQPALRDELPQAVHAHAQHPCASVVGRLTAERYGREWLLDAEEVERFKKMPRTSGRPRKWEQERDPEGQAAEASEKAAGTPEGDLAGRPAESTLAGPVRASPRVVERLGAGDARVSPEEEADRLELVAEEAALASRGASQAASADRLEPGAP